MIDTTGAKILVIDDDTISRGLLTKIVTDEGYDCIDAASGTAAFSIIQKHLPDLILLDAEMPDMSGFEVAMRLKGSIETQGIPIIMVTTLDDQVSIERGLSLGVEEFLSKPVKPNELQIRVRNLLRLKLANNS